MKLIVGLGNVGAQFSGTRHNLGFMVIDQLAKRHDMNFSHNDKLQVDAAKGTIALNHEIILIKPTTMMNLSGEAVAKVMRFYKDIPIEDVWVIYDELDLEFGKLRVRDEGGSAGHNGVSSVVDSIGPNFIRWRLGVGKPEHKGQTVEYVLHAFSDEETKNLPVIIDRTISQLERKLKEDRVAPESFRLLAN